MKPTPPNIIIRRSDGQHSAWVAITDPSGFVVSFGRSLEATLDELAKKYPDVESVIVRLK
jgi:hypothetical protein